MHSEYVTPKIDIDALLRRTYVDNVPLGYNDKVFSLYQPGWGFDRKDLYRTGNPRGWNMAVTVELDGVPFSVSSAEFIPSYVTSYGNRASENVSVTGYKYISPKEYAAVILLAENKGERSVTVTVRAASNVTVPKEGVLCGTAAGLPITVLGDDGFCVAGRTLTRVQILNSGETAIGLPLIPINTPTPWRFRKCASLRETLPARNILQKRQKNKRQPSTKSFGTQKIPSTR